MRGYNNPNPTPLEIARRDAGLTRAQLSDLTGISLRVIERYEQRRININNAAVSKVRDIAKVLNVPIDKIINE